MNKKWYKIEEFQWIKKVEENIYESINIREVDRKENPFVIANIKIDLNQYSLMKKKEYCEVFGINIDDIKGCENYKDIIAGCIAEELCIQEGDIINIVNTEQEAISIVNEKIEAE